MILTNDEECLLIDSIKEVGYTVKENAILAANALHKITGKPYRAAHSRDCQDCNYFVELYNEDYTKDGDEIEWY